MSKRAKQVVQSLQQGKEPQQAINENLDMADVRHRVEEQETQEETVEAIVDLIERDFEDLEDQGAFAELVQGLAFDENEIATEFIAELQDGERMQDVAMIAGEEAELPDAMQEMIEDAEPGGT